MAAEETQRRLSEQDFEGSAVDSGMDENPILLTNLSTPKAGVGDATCTGGDDDSIVCKITYYASIILPLMVTALLTWRGRFDPDTQVLELKSGAARIEEEIYKFRTRTCQYGRAALAAGDDDDDSGGGGGGGGGAVRARERFGANITAIWDGLLKSVVTEHSMPRRLEGHNHTTTLNSEYKAAQGLMSKYMPGEMVGDDDDDEGGAPNMDKAVAKKAAALKKKADRLQVLTEQAAGAADGVGGGGLLSKGLNGLKGLRGGSTSIAPEQAVKKPDEEEGKDGGAAEAMQSDSGFGPLKAEEYVKFRMLPKLILYSKLSPLQARTLAICEITAIGLSTLNSLLGAFDMSQPVPLIVQIGSTIGAWQAYKQMKMALKLTNAAVGQLERLCLWWQSLSMIEKRRPDSKEKLVRITEDVISSSVPELAIRKQMESSDDGDSK